MKEESLETKERTTSSVNFMITLFWFSEDKEAPQYRAAR